MSAGRTGRPLWTWRTGIAFYRFSFEKDSRAYRTLRASRAIGTSWTNGAGWPHVAITATAIVEAHEGPDERYVDEPRGVDSWQPSISIEMDGVAW